MSSFAAFESTRISWTLLDAAGRNELRTAKKHPPALAATREALIPKNKARVLATRKRTSVVKP
jgi:hypothetical protein